MSTATLKQWIGDAGSGMDKSHGGDRLYDVLKAIAEALSQLLTAHQATIATATLSGLVVDKATKLIGLRTEVGVCGTADDTTVQVHLNGVSQGELTTGNAEADGTKKSLVLDVDLVAGDVVELVVSAAPTAGDTLNATAILNPITIA